MAQLLPCGVGLEQSPLGYRNETHLPTVQDSPRPYPWLSGSHEDPWWPRRHQRPPCQRAQASGCLSQTAFCCATEILFGLRSKVQRLQTRSQFQAVLAGTTVARTVHFAFHRVALDGPADGTDLNPSSAAPSKALFVVPGVWLGAMVPKRWAKRAVTRNMIKRQIFAVGAGFEPRLPRSAHLIRLRSGFDRAQYTSATSDALKAAVRSELQQLFVRAVTP